MDEQTFADSFGAADWAVMMIMSKTGKFYCRMRMTTGALTTHLHLPVVLTTDVAFPAGDMAQWDAELKEKVTAMVAPPRPFQETPAEKSRWGNPIKATLIPGAKPTTTQLQVAPKVEEKKPKDNKFPGGHWLFLAQGRMPCFYGPKILKASMAPEHGLMNYLKSLEIAYAGTEEGSDEATFTYKDKLYTGEAIVRGLVKEGRARLLEKPKEKYTQTYRYFTGGRWEVGENGKDIPVFYGAVMAAEIERPESGLQAYFIKCGVEMTPSVHGGYVTYLFKLDGVTYGPTTIVTALEEKGLAKRGTYMYQNTTQTQTHRQPARPKVDQAVIDTAVNVFKSKFRGPRAGFVAFDVVKYPNGEEVLASMQIKEGNAYIFLTQAEAELYSEIVNGDVVDVGQVEKLADVLLSGEGAIEDRFRLNTAIDTTWYNLMIEIGVNPAAATVWSRLATLKELKDVMGAAMYRKFFTSYETTPT